MEEFGTETKSIKFEVYGRRVTVELAGGGWRAWYYGADGKRRPAEDIQIPSQLNPEEVASYLADLCHEWASTRYPEVKRLN